MVRGERDDLVVRAKRGEEVAWVELYGDHADRLVLWLRHLPHLDAASDAEDVAAEAWLVAARKVCDFSGDRRDFAGWLFAIARNISRTRDRTSRRRGTSPTGSDAAGGTWVPAEDPAAAIVAADATRRLVAQLPEREAQVVACLDVVGLDVATTGTALGMSATAVRVAHHRGLGRLRRILGCDGAPVVPDVTRRPARDM